MLLELIFSLKPITSGIINTLKRQPNIAHKSLKRRTSKRAQTHVFHLYQLLIFSKLENFWSCALLQKMRFTEISNLTSVSG